MTRRDDDLDQLAEDELNVLSPDGGMLPPAGSGWPTTARGWPSGATPAAAPTERVEDLLRRMTLAEKAGQLRSTWLGSTAGGGGGNGGRGKGTARDGGELGMAGWRRCTRSWRATWPTGRSSSAMGSAS